MDVEDRLGGSPSSSTVPERSTVFLRPFDADRILQFSCPNNLSRRLFGRCLLIVGFYRPFQVHDVVAE